MVCHRTATRSAGMMLRCHSKRMDRTVLLRPPSPKRRTRPTSAPSVSSRSGNSDDPVGTLALSDFKTEILAGLGNRTESSLSDARLVNGLNMAQSRIDRAYAFSEMAQVSFASMNFTGNPALDKFLVPPPRLRSIHSFVLLDTSAGVSSLGQSQKVTERPWLGCVSVIAFAPFHASPDRLFLASLHRNVIRSGLPTYTTCTVFP